MILKTLVMLGILAVGVVVLALLYVKDCRDSGYYERRKRPDE